MGVIRGAVKGHNDPSNVSNLRGIGESLMWHFPPKRVGGGVEFKVMAAAAEVMPAVVGGTGNCSSDVTK